MANMPENLEGMRKGKGRFVISGKRANCPEQMSLPLLDPYPPRGDPSRVRPWQRSPTVVVDLRSTRPLYGPPECEEAKGGIGNVPVENQQEIKGHPGVSICRYLDGERNQPPRPVLSHYDYRQPGPKV